MTRRLLLPLVLLGLLPFDAAAQSLAEIARAEAERRKTVASPGKVYTNESLRPDPFTPPVATPPAAPADAEGAGPDADTEEPAGTVRDEAYWSARIGAARDAIQRARMFAEALQSRINALNADFVARDDPAQRALIADERAKALAELDRVNLEIQERTREIAGIEDEARREGVPPGWLRSRP